MNANQVCALLIEKEAIRDLVQRTAAYLDNEQLDDWMALFSADAEYEIVVFTTELRRETTWWKSSRDDLKKLLDDVPRQVRDKGRRLHLVMPVSIEVGETAGKVQSHFAVMRSTPEGKSTIYAQGRYDDILVKGSAGWMYQKHQVLLETRMLETFTHLPL